MQTEGNIQEMTCAEAAKWFNDYVDGYLDELPAKQFDRHIQTCRHCLEKLEFEQMLKAKVASLMTPSHNDKSGAEAQQLLDKIFAK